MFYRKAKKLLSSPGIFFRDYLNNKYPLVFNEINCPINDQQIVIRNDLNEERKIHVNFPIDVVFTWVNDKDPYWIKKFRSSQLSENAIHTETEMARYSNHNEIFYSVNSVLKFMPWVRTVFIVTDSQIPPGLSRYSKVKIVDHRDIMEPSLLPTFNSHVIEAHLHLIPGLAEHFIYFNDDVFVARELPASHFFKGNGHASLFLSGKSLKAMALKGINTPTLFASSRAARLLKSHYNIEIDFPLVHTYVPLRKSIFSAACAEYKKEIEGFLSFKFRTNQDLNLATFFVPWLAYIKGVATPQRDICHYFDIRSPAARMHYEILLKSRNGDTAPHSFCANDFSSSKRAVVNYQPLLIDFLEKYYGNEKKKYV